MQRPTGVTVLAVLSFVFALAILLSILGSGLPLGGGSFLPRLSFWVANLLSQVADWGSHAVGGLAMVALDRVIPPPLFIFVAIYILMALLYAAIGMGFLRMRNWARLLMIALAILDLATTALGYASPRFLIFRQTTIAIAIHVAVLVYLFRPKVKETFGASTI